MSLRITRLGLLLPWEAGRRWLLAVPVLVRGGRVARAWAGASSKEARMNNVLRIYV